MQDKYFEKITKLLEQASPKLAITYRLEFKNVFGAIGVYVNGRIFISCGKFGVVLKFSPQVLVKLFREKDVFHLQYFPNGHVKKEYAVIPQRMLDNSIRFKKLVDKSIHYVLAL